MHTYVYIGPVGQFDKVYAECWKGATRAQSTKKALSNLTFQFKKQYKMAATTKITLYEKYLFEED